MGCVVGVHAIVSISVHNFHSLLYTVEKEIFTCCLNIDSNAFSMCGWIRPLWIRLKMNYYSPANTEMLMDSFISSRMDYCNGLLSGLVKKTISHL